MTPRRLRWSRRAARDLAGRASLLSRERGIDFAEAYCGSLIAWLLRLAESGAQLGTAVGMDPALRVFGYRRQASILAHFTESEIRVVRIYFRGQDGGPLTRRL